jgi:glyoxylase-like metal-dependent hydrolase (beta-lactamase superfamily II)
MVQVRDAEGVTVARSHARFLSISMPYCVYFVDGLLIDTGPYSLRKRLGPVLAGLPVEQVALTHLHEDHCGLAHLFSERGVPVYCLPESVADAPREPRLPLYRRLVWGRRPAFEARPLPEVVRTPDHEFQVLRAPGHTPLHALFYEASRGWLFTGDFFLTTRPRVVFFEEDLSATLESLKRLEGLHVKVLFDAHSGPLHEGAKLLARKRAALEDLGQRVANLRAAGLDDRAIDRRLFPKRPFISRVSFGEWSSLRMVQTVTAPESERLDRD